MKLLSAIFILFLLTSCEDVNAPIKQWSVAKEGIFSAKLSNDAEKLLIGSYTHGASLWNTKKYQRLYNWNHTDALFTPIFNVAISYNQNIAVTTDSHDIAVWNIQTGESLGFWSANDEILDFDIDKNANLAVISTKNHKLTLINLKDGTILSQIVLANNADKIQLTDSARYVITTGSEQKVSVWDIMNKVVLYDFSIEKRAEYLKIDEENDLFIIQPFRQDAQIHELSTGKLISTIPINNQSITHAQFTHEAKRLIIGTNTNKIELWQPKLSKKIKQWQLPKISNSRFSSDSVLDIKEINKRYLCVSTDGFLYLL